MGVYIDMEMPKSCDKCPCISHYYDDRWGETEYECGVTKDHLFTKDGTWPITEIIEKPDNCPLIEIPQKMNATDIEATDIDDIVAADIELLDESCAIVCCSCFVSPCIQEKCPVYHLGTMIDNSRNPFSMTEEVYEICEKYFSCGDC